MKHLLFAVLLLGSIQLQAQIIKTHSQFTKEAEFEKAMQSFDFSSFLDKEATITIDTSEVMVVNADFNKELKKRLKLPKNYVIRKAASTNYGYTISFGVYRLGKKGEEEDAACYIVFNLDFQTGKIKDVEIQPNS